jgi:hypothetical protein
MIRWWDELQAIQAKQITHTLVIDELEIEK